MIKEITLKGFKSFTDKSISLGPLTLLLGLNSSGKSSLIQGIRILERVARNHTSPLLPGHGSAEELQNPRVKEPFSLEASFETGSMLKSMKWTSGIKPNKECEFPELTYISASRFGPQTSIPITEGYHILENGNNVLKCIDHYQDIQLPELIRHENSEGDTLYFNLRGWLTCISPGVKFNHEIQRKTDSSYATYNGYRAKNVGFGLSYILPVITSLLLGSTRPGSAVIIENPEAHLHPKGQTELARLACLTAMSGCQVIIETHSDHFFDGVRIFAKHHPEFAKEISVNWFEQDRDGNSTVETPHVLPSGRLDSWPPGMFDQFEINAEELL